MHETQAGHAGLISGLGRSPGGGNGNPLQTLPAKSHGERSLAGYSLWGLKGEGHNLMTEHIDREKQNS